MNAPFRPALRYLGGKWRLAPWINRFFPPHNRYVETHGGAASVLLRKERMGHEVYNDLDGQVVGLFRVLRDRDQAAELVRLLRLTPFARAEFRASYEPSSDPVEAARRLIVRSFLGHGGNASDARRAVGFRGQGASRRSPERDWANYPEALEAIIRRIEGVRIEQMPALTLLHGAYDAPETLFYVDPPYLHSTRSGKRIRGALYNAYPIEMGDEDHLDLLLALRQSNAMVVLSGYPNWLYDQLLSDWRREECATYADGARPRTEVLWINPLAAEALDASGARKAVTP